MTTSLDSPELDNDAISAALSTSASNDFPLFGFYANTAWAILQESLVQIRDIYVAALDRKESGAKFEFEAVAARAGRPMDKTNRVEMRDGVAIIPVSGPIFRRANMFTQMSGATSINLLAKDFTTALEDPGCVGILFDINSPGGEVDGTSEFAQMIFDARDQKPITAYVSHLGASAAYWIASACSEIVAADTASLGSIGVVAGVSTSKDPRSVEFVSSQSPRKRPDVRTEAGRSQMQSYVDDLATVFVDRVARNRGVSTDTVLNDYGAGGLSVGTNAVTAGLADRVGSLEEVIADMSSSRKGAKRPAVASAPTTEGVITMKTREDATTAVDDEKPVTGSPSTEPAKPTGDSDEVARLREQLATAKAKADENEAKATAATQDAESARAETAKVTDRVGALEKANREARFTATAKEFAGATDTHVEMMEALATNCGGEDGKPFITYVEQQRAATERLRQSALLGETGRSGAASDTNSAEAQLELKAKALRETDPKLTSAQAYSLALKQNPELYDQHKAESANAD